MAGSKMIKASGIYTVYVENGRITDDEIAGR